MTEFKIVDSSPRTPEIILNMTRLDGSVYAFTNYGRVLLSMGDSWMEPEYYNWPLPPRSEESED